MNTISKPLKICLFVLSCLLVFFALSNSTSEKVSPDTQISSILPQQEDTKTYGQYSVSSIKVNDLKKVGLFTNLSTKELSSDLKQKHNCKYLVNAGFYSKEDTHLGLFIQEARKIEDVRKSSLFNGIFWVDKNREKSFIKEQLEPSTSPFLAVQSGPVLIKNKGIVKINSNSEDGARRIVLAIDNQGDIYFLVFYNKDSVFTGPTLTQLPELVGEFGKSSQIVFVDALNLDGGSASAFYSDQLELSELSIIGGFFCMSA